MTTITFSTRPATRRINNDGLLELRCASTDEYGDRYEAGTRLRAAQHGTAGYAYTVVTRG